MNFLFGGAKPAPAEPEKTPAEKMKENVKQWQKNLRKEILAVDRSTRGACLSAGHFFYRGSFYVQGHFQLPPDFPPSLIFPLPSASVSGILLLSFLPAPAQSSRPAR